MSKKHKNKAPNQEVKVDNSPRVLQRDKLKDPLKIKEFPWTEKQKKLINLILDKETKIVFIQGPAGTAKSLISIYCGLQLLNEKKIGTLTYIRTAIESSSKSLGYTPGSVDEKMEMYMAPMQEKLEELLSNSEIQGLINDGRVKGDVVNYMRGRSTKNSLWCCDEIQNFSYAEIITIITRLSKFSKIVLCGDLLQSDLHGKSGMKTVLDIFNDQESRDNGIHYFEFGTEDIMRSETVKFILEKLEKHKAEKAKEPMFS